MGYSGAQGTLIYEKNLKAKISFQTPFKKIYFLSRTVCWWSSWRSCPTPLPPPSPTWRQSRSRQTTWYLPHLTFIINRLCFVFFLSQMQVFFCNACSHTQYSYNVKKRLTTFTNMTAESVPADNMVLTPHTILYYLLFFGGL